MPQLSSALSSSSTVISPHQFYYATSQKSTAVTHSVVGQITAPNELNLVLGKTSRIEIYRITNEGLSPLCDIGINGRIGTMNIIRIAVSIYDDEEGTEGGIKRKIIDNNAGSTRIRSKFYGRRI